MDSVNCFDDSFFDCAINNPKPKASLSSVSYTPKFQGEEWYNDVEEGETDEEQTSILKFRADKLYSEGHFEEAIVNYGRVIPSLESTNVTLKRDCLEGILRSLIKLGKYSDALLKIDELLKLSRSSSQFCSIWRIAAQIHERNRDHKSEISTLHLLLNHHKLCFKLWFNLARAYSRIYGIRLACCFDDGDDITDECSYSVDDSEIDLRSLLIVTSCLIRAKMIINSVENNPQYLNFPSTRDLRLKIDQQISKLTLPSGFLSTARDSMCGDVRSYEDESNFDQLSIKDESNIPDANSQDFEKFWFSWLEKFLPEKQM